jgi:hypothetical protein
MANTICAQCGSTRIHRSRRRHVSERIITAFGGGMRRCHQCNSRFVRVGGSMLRIADLRRASQRLALAIGMLIAAALIMVTILWFSRAQSSSASDTERLQPNELTRRS